MSLMVLKRIFAERVSMDRRPYKVWMGLYFGVLCSTPLVFDFYSKHHTTPKVEGYFLYRS